MSKERRHWNSDDKIKLLRRHLIEKVPISSICDEARLAPSLSHRWQEQLFVNASLALEGNRPDGFQRHQLSNTRWVSLPACSNPLTVEIFRPALKTAPLGSTRMRRSTVMHSAPCRRLG